MPKTELPKPTSRIRQFGPLIILAVVLPMAIAIAYQKGYFDFGDLNFVNPLGKSIYEGTYTGTFNYEYQKNGQGGWIPASFDLTFTLEGESEINGRAYPYVTYVKCSDPAFGAVDGVEPVASLSSVEFKANPPATPEVRLSDHNEAIIIRFPNTAYIEIPANAGGSLSGRFLIRSDGKAMYSSPDYPDDLWYAVTGSWPFKGYTAPGEDFYEVNYESWSLTKVSH
jgi:hypothetical protein